MCVCVCVCVREAFHGQAYSTFCGGGGGEAILGNWPLHAWQPYTMVYVTGGVSFQNRNLGDRGSGMPGISNLGSTKDFKEDMKFKTSLFSYLEDFLA